MAVHDPKEFDGCCPKCGTARIDFLENTRNDFDEKVIKFYCWKCKIAIVVNSETDEVEEFYDN